MRLLERNKWEVLALLWIAFFLNQADRQVFNVIIPLIKADLQLTDIQIGTIATAFNLVFALIVPFAGYIGDLFSRKWIAVLSILFWSIATMFTGLSTSVLMLIIFRSIATGGGEAFFAPASFTLIASYHKKTRAFAMSIQQTSYYLGIILSGYLAGIIAERWGWRSAFYVFGSVGVIHAFVMAFRLKDKKEEIEPTKKEEVRFAQGIKILFGTPTALMLTIAYSGLIFVLTGYLTWMPTYLYEKFNMSISNAGFYSMFFANIFAFIGVLIAGRSSDAISKKNPARRLLMQGLGLLTAVPFILLMGNSNILSVIFIGLAGFGFARSFFDANTYTVLYDVIPQKYQSSVTGIKIMIGFSIGALSPLILGYLKSKFGLSFGISSLAIVWVFCGTLLLIAYKFYFKNDYEKVH